MKRCATLTVLCGLAAGASAQGPTDEAASLEQCALIGAATDRLNCYDRLAGRAPAPDVPPAQQPPPGEEPAAAALPPSLLTQAGGPLPPAPAPSPAPSSSLLSKFWELDPADKRGVFNFVGYQPNYVLPMHVSSRVNRAPQSPTQGAVAMPDNRREEAKFQLSVRTKLLQGVGFPGADLWGAFTMQTLWQVYNHADSRPFRNSNYQPELIYVVPTAPGLRATLPFGWQWRFTELGLAHQSNGQSDPLSRSWNRVYLGAGFERGNWTFTTRLNRRLRERIENDNNPDLLAYRGKAEFTLGWSSGRHTASLHHRSTLRSGGRGGTSLEWTYPVSRDQPNGLRWYVQLYSGYGETLLDYNFRQTSLGAGVSFLQF